MTELQLYDVNNEDLTHITNQGQIFVTFGEVMIRETPADAERPEQTKVVRLSMAGSEYTLAIGLSRMGIPSTYITRVPNNPYGKAVQNIARSHGVATNHLVWAPKTEPIGRFIYEIGRTPRKDIGVYQRMFSAASRLDAGMVDWSKALKNCRLFHTSGITFGLSYHSNYKRNYLHEAFLEAIKCLPDNGKVGLDFNYRSTLWSKEQARDVMTPIITKNVNILITTIEDMALLYEIPCGQYSAKQVVDGDIGVIEDDDIRRFAERIQDMFAIDIVAVTIRYPDTFEKHRWESAAVDNQGNFYRSPQVRSMVLTDRLGGGDTWNAGFYYGLLTENFSSAGLEKGVLVGDAYTRLKQTLMFDLPIVDKSEIQALMKEDIYGGGKRTSR
jgi:2-dehydro-3-deoxygluconokinase